MLPKLKGTFFNYISFQSLFREDHDMCPLIGLNVAHLKVNKPFQKCPLYNIYGKFYLNDRWTLREKHYLADTIMTFLVKSH